MQQAQRLFHSVIYLAEDGGINALWACWLHIVADYNYALMGAV